MRNTSKSKWMLGIASMSLLTSVPSPASEELFDYEWRQRTHAVDPLSAQGELEFLSTWAASPTPAIQQRTLATAENLIKTWVLQPPAWFPAIAPQAVATAAHIYQIASEHPSNEPPETTRLKEEVKGLLEEQALQTEKGALPPPPS